MASCKLIAIFLVFVLCTSTIDSTCDSCGTCGCTPVNPEPTAPTSPGNASCSLDILKLGACANVLGLLGLNIGNPDTSQCCPLLQGIADVEAAVCLCTAIKANVLGINLNVPVSLSALLSACQMTVPPGFQCE